MSDDILTGSYTQQVELIARQRSGDKRVMEALEIRCCEGAWLTARFPALPVEDHECLEPGFRLGKSRSTLDEKGPTLRVMTRRTTKLLTSIGTQCPHPIASGCPDRRKVEEGSQTLLRTKRDAAGQLGYARWYAREDEPTRAGHPPSGGDDGSRHLRPTTVTKQWAVVFNEWRIKCRVPAFSEQKATAAPVEQRQADQPSIRLSPQQHRVGEPFLHAAADPGPRLEKREIRRGRLKRAPVGLKRREVGDPDRRDLQGEGHGAAEGPPTANMADSGNRWAE